MRRAVVVLVAVVALAGPALVVAPMARGATPNQKGWWWSGHLSQLPLSPPPPNVPKGGLYVASGLSGASGLSALRFDLPDGATDPVLTLHVADSSGTVVLGACRVAGPWEPAEAGAWDKRPTPACEEGAVAAETSGEGDAAVVRIPVAALADDDVIDLVLVPGTDPSTGASATFDISFDPPGEDALVATTPDDDGGTVTTTTAFASPTPPPNSPDVTFDAPVPETPAPPAEPFTAAANIGEVSPPGEDLSSPPLAVSSPSGSEPDDAQGRIVGLVLGLLVAGTWYILTRTALGAQFLALSGGATGAVRGIGRFAAPRDEPRPTL